jgi:hypothetical protein
MKLIACKVRITPNARLRRRRTNPKSHAKKISPSLCSLCGRLDPGSDAQRWWQLRWRQTSKIENKVTADVALQ